MVTTCAKTFIRRLTGRHQKAKADEADATNPDVQKQAQLEGMSATIEKLDRVYSRRGDYVFEPWNSRRGAPKEISPDAKQYGKFALVLWRKFSPGPCPEVEGTYLDIKSPLIRDVLKEVLVEQAAEMHRETPIIEWPCEEFFLERETIRRTAAESGALTVAHVNVLLGLIADTFSQEISDVNSMIPKGLINWSIIREIFRPGVVIFSCGRAFRTISTERTTDEGSNTPIIRIHYSYVENDGTRLGTATGSLKICCFEGTRFIKDLSAFPISNHPDLAEIKTKLIQRGQFFATLTGKKYLHHKGIAAIIDGKKTGQPVDINSRVMIDTGTFNRREAASAISCSGTIEIPNDDDFLLCSNIVPVFSFVEKTYAMADVGSLSEIVFNTQVFDQLVIPVAQKELIRVLVESHAKVKGFDDFVAGKGKGLICVLHGPPGVGKTMTAEAVSEHTRRPLYSVTSGELGSNPAEMETELTKVLDLVQSFGAVLLLDEADVFLEQRTSQDMERNRLVSIFLRLLEYYQGIMFLTTNRIQTFDDAFHSRIHISLSYKTLGEAAREQIWRNFGATMPTTLEDGDYKVLAKATINGRQVKNVVKTAEALASDKGQTLGVDHITTVLDMMKSFDLSTVNTGRAG